MAEPVALGIKPPTPMSLGDMISIARGAQAYQQAEQANPLALQKAQMEIEQAQKMNPLAVREKSAQTTTAETGATKSKAELNAYYRDQSRKTFGGLLTDKDFDPLNPNPEGMKIKLQEAHDYLTNVLGVPEHESKAQAKLLEHIDKHGIFGAQRVIQQIANGVQQAGTTSEQFAQANRAPVAYDTGGKIIQTTTSPYQLTQTPKTVQYGKTLAPQIYTTETGAPGIIGGAGGGVQNPNVVPTNQPTVPTQLIGTTPAKNVNQQLVGQFNATGALQRSPDETYEAYRARVADLAAKPKQANNALSLANRDSIVNQEYNNNQVLSLLDKKDLDIGPLASAIANKTGGLGLSDDQQKIVKYLEQRIRMESARSNQDESSQRNAFGSFKNSKEALREIIYNDKGLLASQRLYNQGLLKAQGNPNQPNLAAINNFENQFNQLNQDPHLPHLLGVMGNKKMEQLTDSEKRHLNKYFEKMPDDEIRKLFADRDALLNLVRGGK